MDNERTDGCLGQVCQLHPVAALPGAIAHGLHLHAWHVVVDAEVAQPFVEPGIIVRGDTAVARVLGYAGDRAAQVAVGAVLGHPGGELTLDRVQDLLELGSCNGHGPDLLQAAVRPRDSIVVGCAAWPDLEASPSVGTGAALQRCRGPRHSARQQSGQTHKQHACHGCCACNHCCARSRSAWVSMPGGNGSGVRRTAIG